MVPAHFPWLITLIAFLIFIFSVQCTCNIIRQSAPVFVVITRFSCREKICGSEPIFDADYCETCKSLRPISNILVSLYQYYRLYYCIDCPFVHAIFFSLLNGLISLPHLSVRERLPRPIPFHCTKRERIFFHLIFILLKFHFFFSTL